MSRLNKTIPMAKITRELLHGYLDDVLSDTESASVELELRRSPQLQKMLRSLVQERDRGEHSLGAIWSRNRLSCPSREQLGNYLLQVLDAAEQDYVSFHLHTVGCAFCLANLTDLQNLNREPAPKTKARRKRYLDSSAGYFHAQGDKRA